MKKLMSFFLGSTLVIPLMSGCAVQGRAYVRTYNPADAPDYFRWEHETQRQHMEYESRKKAEQHEYWEWRKHRDRD